MSLGLIFDSPFLLGFDHTRALIERAARASDTWPPYNVEEVGEDGVRISLAVAGFSAADLTVSVEARQLAVAGKREEAQGADRAFVHRGIAARAFTRTFVLADGLEVTGAVLEHGLLHIDLVRVPPETRTKLVPIRTAG